MSSNPLRAVPLFALLLAGCGHESPPAPPAASSASSASPVAEPSPSASASVDPALALASASAPLPSGSAVARKPPLPALADNPPSDEKTPAPSAAEWASAPEVSLTRHSDQRCSAKRLREWVRIFCSSAGNGFSMIAGERAGVSYGSQDTAPDFGGWLVFPVRRGDQRLIQLHGWAKWGWVASVVVSEQWLAGDKGPLLTVMNV